MLAPIEIPASSITVPTNVLVAPRVVAAPGVQYTSLASAPPVNVIIVSAPVVNAPVDLKI